MAAASDQITDLINEIHWLSGELKKRTALRSEQQRVLLASKGLLHTLAEQGPRTVPAIAEARNTSRQNIQVIANRLAEEGCVEFVPNPTHKKSDLVRLTQSGAALLKSSSRQETAVLEALQTQLGSMQMDSALEILRELRNVLSDGAENAAASRQPVAVPVHDEPMYAPAKHIGPMEEPTEDDSLPVNLL